MLCRTYAALVTGAGKVRIYKGHFTKRSGEIEGGSHKSGDSKSKNAGGEVPHCVASSALRGDVGTKAWNGD